jgi:parvulin-like peptidyl-prolyl isomerase
MNKILIIWLQLLLMFGGISPVHSLSAADEQQTDEQAGTNPEMHLDADAIKQIFANLNDSQRAAYTRDAATFRQFIEQEAAALSLSTAARANNLHQDENTALLMQRMAENVLREAYLNRLIAGRIPADFPSDAQVEEYFEKNKDQFVIEERIHVWQIFLQIHDAADRDEVTRQEQLADTIIKDILKGKIDFSTAALTYSEHNASMANGGYLGLLRFSELKPEVNEALRQLPEGGISSPVLADDGIHILRRGILIPRQEINLEQVRPQVKELLYNQATAQLRQAIYNQAGKTYPVALDEQEIEIWRLQLQPDHEPE